MTSQHSVRWQLVRWGILLATLVAMVWHVVHNRATYPSLFSIHPGFLFLLWGLESLFLAANAVALVLQLKVFGSKIPFRQSFVVCVHTSLANTLAPFRGGTAIRAAYLKRVFGHSLTDFATFSLVIMMVNQAILVTTGLIALAAHGIIIAFWLAGLAILTLLSSVAGLFLLQKRFSGAKPIESSHKWVNKVKRSVICLIHSPRCMAWLVGVLLFNLGLRTLSVWSAYHSVGVQIGWTGAVVVVAAAGLALVVQITPGNLGIQEAVIAISGVAMGQDFSEGLVAAALLRLVALATLAFWSAGAFVWGGSVAPSKSVDDN